MKTTMMLRPFGKLQLSMVMTLLTIFCWWVTVQSSELGYDACGDSVRPATCPVKCFRTDPVCGEDGVTYWCGCGEARCSGVSVAKLGFCEVRNQAGSEALLLVYLVWLVVLAFGFLFSLI